MWQNGEFLRWPKMETISIWAIARQKSCLQLYVCLDLKYKVSISLDRGKSGYEIRRILRRKPKVKVAMLRLFREEHKYSLAFEKSFRLHCRESPIEAYLKERRRRTRRAWKIRFRSFFRNLFDFEDSNASSTTPWTTKKMLTENLRQIPYKFK